MKDDPDLEDKIEATKPDVQLSATDILICLERHKFIN